MVKILERLVNNPKARRLHALHALSFKLKTPPCQEK
jgi:hypothetical protein